MTEIFEKILADSVNIAHSNTLTLDEEENKRANGTNIKIYRLGDDILSKSCVEVPIEIIHAKDPMLSEAVKIAHNALDDFRRKNGFGRAISAPQVGFPIRMIAMHLHDKSWTIFNPIITHKSDETFTMWDDCLSFPNLMCCVRRYASISISFLDEQGQHHVWEDCAQDVSELLQHEIDHLDGILAVNIAVKPDNKVAIAIGCAAVVNRTDWLTNKVNYISYVDYHIQ